MKIPLPQQNRVTKAVKDKIVTVPTQKPRMGWKEQFKAAVTNGDKPENDFSKGMENDFDFDKNGWTW